MDKQVRFETSGGLGILTLANPPLNLFSEELIEDLRGAVTAAKQTPLRALMVRAEGKIFSGGADVRMFKGRTSAHARERVTSHLRTIADLEELPCPTLAAVQRSEEHTSELQSRQYLVCRLLLEKKKKN